MPGVPSRFPPKAREVYGAWTSTEQAVELLEACNTVFMASPDYQSKHQANESQPEDGESRFEGVVDTDTVQVEGGPDQDVLEITVYDNCAKMCVVSHSVRRSKDDPKRTGPPTLRLRRGAPGLSRQSGPGV